MTRGRFFGILFSIRDGFCTQKRAMKLTLWLYQKQFIEESFNANDGLEKERDLIRAVLEGICYHLRWLLECEMRKVKTSDTIRFVGGGALSPVTCQMLSDIIGRTIETVDHSQEVGAIGTALVVAAGLKGVDVLDLSRELVKVENVYVPNPENKEVYERNYKVFKKLYSANAKNFKILNMQNSGYKC